MDSQPNAVGYDNRDHGTGLREGPDVVQQMQTQLDADGAAWTHFETAHQPGDNHRVATTLKQAAIDQLNDHNVPPSGQPGPPNPPTEDQVGTFTGHISRLLTVWRTLHVETDSMVRPTFNQNTFTTGWDEPEPGPVATQVLIDVFEGPFQSSSQQFRGGWVELRDDSGNRVAVARVVDFEADPWDDIATLNFPDTCGGQDAMACLGGVESGDAIFSDDDLTDATTFDQKTSGCDDVYALDGLALAPPELGALELRYHPAYIHPIHQVGVSSAGSLTTFHRNLDLDANNGLEIWNQALPPVRDLPVSTPEYWTVMVLSSWQAEVGEDKDPDGEADDPPGITLGASAHDDGEDHSFVGPQYTGMCTVFKAVVGEIDGREQYTVVHEVGHTFGLDHDDDGAMCATGNCQLEPFTIVSLKKLRSYDGP